MHNPQCPEEKLDALKRTISLDDSRGITLLEDLLAEFPGDGRLYFLKGMMLASWHENGAAIVELERAVRLAPEYWLARLHLGILLYSSGYESDALDTWEPLHRLPEADAIRLFASGLTKYVLSEFSDAKLMLSKGIRNNHTDTDLNRFMQRLVNSLLRKQILDVAASPHRWLARFLAK